MKTCLKLLVIFCSILSLVSCATIMGEKTQLMALKSTPCEAVIKITDEEGTEIFIGKTPTTVTLEKADGSYFGGKAYTVIISKEGYETQTIPVVAKANEWYFAGNYICGGPIGWLIIDPFNGSMYTLKPEKLNTYMDKKFTHNNSATKNNISIVLLEDVPTHLQEKMVPIN